MKKICLNFLLIASCLFAINKAYGASYTAAKLYNKGIEQVQNKEYAQAARSFKRAINEDPSLSDAYFNLGSVYNHLGEKDSAIEILNVLIRKNPSDEDTTFLLANLYLDKGKNEKALIYLNSIDELSYKYDKAQELISAINKKIEEKNLADKKASIDWDKKVIKDLASPTGVTTDSEGNIYIANYTNGIIQKADPKGKIVNTFTNQDIMKGPLGLAIDSKDNIYVANYISNNLIQISKNGEFKIVLEEIKRPYYLFIEDDILYVTEQETNSLVILNLDKVELVAVLEDLPDSEETQPEDEEVESEESKEAE